MTAFDPILRGGTFTFHVGPDLVPFVIHKKVVEDNSEVLARLMNNGAMEESTTGIAQLPDTDIDIFALFAEFAYTRVYRVPNQPAQSTHEVLDGLNIYCYACDVRQSLPGVQRSTLVDHPRCPSCNSKFTVIGDPYTQQLTWNVIQAYPMSSQKRKRAFVSTYTDIFPPRNLSAIGHGEAAERFRMRQYPALGISHEQMTQYLDSLIPVDSVTQNITIHAKIYVFCQKYMADALKKFCLHKLHRDLLRFNLTSNSIYEIVEILTYTYNNTTDEEDEEGDDATETAQNDVMLGTYNSDGTRPMIIDSDDSDSGTPQSNVAVSSWQQYPRRYRRVRDRSDWSQMTARYSPTTPVLTDDQQLRDLVMSYAIARAQDLMKYSVFKDLLYDGGQIVSDFTEGLARRLNTV